MHDLDALFRDLNRAPDLHEAMDIVVQLAHDMDTLIICVDGMDSSSVSEQTNIWSGLSRVLQERRKPDKSTKILIVSENESRIAVFIPNDAFRIRLEQESISQDIEIYIESRLQERARKRHLFYDADLRRRLKKSLLLKAEHMSVTKSS